MRSSRTRLGSPTPLIGERATHFGLGLASSPRTMPPTTGPRSGAGVHGSGLSVGTAWEDVEIEERALCQGCTGLLQSGGRLKGCPGPSPRCGVDGWKGKGLPQCLGNMQLPKRKEKGTVGKKWG